MNPLDQEGVQFAVEFMNPNPTSSKTKDGPKYRVSFEVQRDVWDCFMDANTSGMVLDGILVVTALGASGAPEDDKPKGGPYSKEAAMLCQDELANAFAETCGYKDLKHMIYSRCGITSRAQLDHDPDAYAQFQDIKGQYVRAML